jgi:hypothetical protein
MPLLSRTAIATDLDAIAALARAHRDGLAVWSPTRSTPCGSLT